MPITKEDVIKDPNLMFDFLSCLDSEVPTKPEPPIIDTFIFIY